MLSTARLLLIAALYMGLVGGNTSPRRLNDRRHPPEARWITESYRVGESMTYDSDLLAITKISNTNTVSPVVVTSTLYSTVYDGLTDTSTSAQPTAALSPSSAIINNDGEEGVVAVAINTSGGTTSLIDVSFTDSHVTSSSTAAKSTASSASSTGSASSSSDDTSSDSQTWVDAHNKARSKYGAANLVWDSDLAVVAEQHAKLCNKAHTKAAENLQWGSGTGTPQGAVDAWVSEAADYSWSNPVYSESTGHFTQVVWKDTKRVGCYIATCPVGSVVDKKYTTSFQTTCEYDPAGNYVNAGDFAANVGQLVS